MDKTYLLSDGGGLQLCINTSGSKSWLFRYVHPLTKKTQNISMGQYPAQTLSQARKQREQAKELLDQNVDPKEKRDQLLQDKQDAIQNTFGVVALQ